MLKNQFAALYDLKTKVVSKKLGSCAILNYRAKSLHTNNLFLSLPRFSECVYADASFMAVLLRNVPVLALLLRFFDFDAYCYENYDKLVCSFALACISLLILSPLQSK
jgi:hypothetical protein